MFLTLASLLFAICHGSALPLAMYVFGDLTNLFANYDITLQVYQGATDLLPMFFGSFTFLEEPPTGNATTIENAVMELIVDPLLLATQDNFTEFLSAIFESVELDLTLELSEVIESSSCVIYTLAEELEPPLTGYEVFSLVTHGNLTLTATDRTCRCIQPLFTDFSEAARCLTDDTFIFGVSIGDGVVWKIYYFVFIAVGVFITGYFQVSLMHMAAERQVNRIRKLFYRSVLRQDIGWFDCNPSGELATRLNE